MLIDGNVFIYYGVILNKSEAYDLAIENNESSIYDVVQQVGLKTQLVGHDSYSDELVIGEEVFWNYGNGAMKLEFTEKVEISTIEVESEENKAALNNVKESEVTEKLRSIGINGQANYYVISSYNVL